MSRFLYSLVIIVVGLLFIGKLISLQLFYKESSIIDSDPAITKNYIYPERGFIYDRNGKILVGNQPAYDVMVIPREVKSLDTLEFISLLDLSKEEFLKRMERARIYSTRLPSVLVANLSKENYAALQEKLRRFDGFFIRKKSLREYYTNSSAHVLGYISEVNTEDVRKNSYYIPGENIGRTGLERQYEEILRGKKGVSYVQKDRFNREIGPYKEGRLDSLPVMGKNINISIDKELQEYGELLMNGKRGGIVAIEPKSGEILSMISGPTYDPSLLVGRKRSENYTAMYYDSLAKPTWDRSILAQPSPGSPFKALNALVALQEGAITPKTTYTCYEGFFVAGEKKGCHCGGGVRDLHNGLLHSCNAYFAESFRSFYRKFDETRIAHDIWEGHMKSFGLGDFLGTDLPTGAPGRIPSTEYYNSAYGKNRWVSTFIISNSIGQGEVAATPLQLANMTAAIANRGYFITPHLIKSIENENQIDYTYREKRYTTIDTKHFDPVIEGMEAVYTSGTARFLQIPGIRVAGKTGTVENFTRIDGNKVQLTDHSVFVAFAPVEDPKIAIAVYIEHGYYGNRYAGHIASLMIEKYLKGSITRSDLEKRMLEKTLDQEYQKPYSGKPFRINEYAW
ncbi:MAG: penicillin-binding transpeptidase domain-containing protein [Bacteroidetes bacterium]|nr:penicillin-binding transpeptidase domain-containing protein [Bacteroidota bacterium]